MPDLQIRPIIPADDPQLAALIVTIMTEIGAVGEGYSIQDAEVQTMSKHYGDAKSQYFVVVNGNTVRGGGGFAPLTDAPKDVCELRKMYFSPLVRGTGKAQGLIDLILEGARSAGYTKMYLETIESATAARKLYERNGFVQIGGCQGNTGHGGCDTFYERSLI